MDAAETPMQDELRAVFAEEAAEGLGRIGELLLRSERRPDDGDLLDGLFREFHTLKVGAAAAGMARAAGELHAAETSLEAVRSGEATLATVAAALRGAVQSVGAQLAPEPSQPPDAIPQPARAAAGRAESLRLIPLASFWRHMLPAVQAAAEADGKQVEFRIDDGDLAVEPALAARLGGPLLHLLHNAVAHGIERPADREACGKPRAGVIAIRARREGGELLLTVADDGAGLDLARIRARGEALGWIEAGIPVSRDDLMRWIFRPGLSTCGAVTAQAGRGVGLDAVARAVDALQGRIEVESHDGGGCTFHVALPLHA